ncbi:MAG: protein kinase [Candidatus Aminicenantes bacterium]|nr:protein kinase [Candidatus Aminicenantes bacterium]
MTVQCPKCQTENPESKPFCADCGTQLPPSKDFHPEVTAETLKTSARELTTGATFAGRYQIVEELGHGGMGRVYKVHDTKIGEKIALKLIRPEALLDRKTVERFTNELKLARKIRHKNICQMFDLGEDQGTHYITMEYIHGEDLKQLIRKVGRLSPGQAIGIARQVCDGLEEAHNLGVVHRDLKPQNIMIDEDGNARIMDFGIARSLSGKGITGAGVMIGTPEYMSPEQVEGKETDQRSDIYSLGVILYEMTTGRVPFEGDTPFTVGVKHKSEPPKDPRELNAQLPQDLSRLILRCLEKDKNARYQTAAEVGEELERIEQGIPTATRLVPERKTRASREITVKFTLRKLAVPLSLLIAAVAVAGIVWQILPRKTAVLSSGGEPILSIAVLPFGYTGTNANLEYLSEGMPESIISSLQQLSSLKTVIALSSVMRYKGKDADPQVVKQELGVDAVLISKIIQVEDELSIRVELVRTADNSRIWGDTYKRKASEIFNVQEEISSAIAENLRLKLGGEEKKRLAKRNTENPAAYKDYLTGRFYWNKRTKEGIAKSLEYFNKAIEKDPSYALAYAGLADSYCLMGRYSYVSPIEAYPKGIRAAEKALEIDKTLGEAHTSLAYIKAHYNFDWTAAEREFKLAIEFNPNYATAHHWYALILSALGRDNEALAEIKRAVELDPLSLQINTNAAWVHYFARDYDRAIEIFKKTLEMDPNYALAHGRLGLAYLEKRLFAEAIAELEKAVDFSPGNTEILAALGHALAVSGKRARAEKILAMLNELSGDSYVSAYDKATIYLGLGDDAKALEYLEKAYEERAGYMSFIKADPRFERLHANPIFIALLKKINL